MVVGDVGEDINGGIGEVEVGAAGDEEGAERWGELGVGGGEGLVEVERGVVGGD